MKPTATRADVELLYERHVGELHGYLYGRSGAAGADLVADVFVIALQRLEDLPAPELRRAWLFGTARRLLLAEQRRSIRRTVAEQERARFVTTEAAPEPEQDHAGVREALASLSEKDQELIRLTEWDQLSIGEAALVLGVRPGAARVRLHRARRRLAQHPALAVPQSKPRAFLPSTNAPAPKKPSSASPSA